MACAPPDEQPWRLMTTDCGNKIGHRRSTQSLTKRLKVLSPAPHRAKRLHKHDRRARMKQAGCQDRRCCAMNQLIADRIRQRVVQLQHLMKIIQPFRLTTRRSAPFLTKRRSEYLVSLRFNGHGHQTTIVACQCKNVGVRGSLAAGQCSLPLRHGQEQFKAGKIRIPRRC